MQDQETHQTTEVPPSGESSGVMAISPSMMGLTWITFILVTFVLYKVAWKPILAALDKREETIRKAQEDAASIREELQRMEESRKRTQAEADSQAREIIATARRAAEEAGRVIQEKARKEAQILVENAERDITKARDSAVATLRKESADLSIALAGKLIGANLDDSKNRAMVDQMIDRI